MKILCVAFRKTHQKMVICCKQKNWLYVVRANPLGSPAMPPSRRLCGRAPLLPAGRRRGGKGARENVSASMREAGRKKRETQNNSKSHFKAPPFEGGTRKPRWCRARPHSDTHSETHFETHSEFILSSASAEAGIAGVALPRRRKGERAGWGDSHQT